VAGRDCWIGSDFANDTLLPIEVHFMRHAAVKRSVRPAQDLNTGTIESSNRASR